MYLKDWMASNNLESQEIFYLLKNLFEIDLPNHDLFLKPLVLQSLDMCLKLRLSGVPLAKILHKKWFYNDCFITTFATLDPRPETEFILEKIHGKPRTILELGVGTGCLLFSIIKKLYKAKGLGIDISAEALKIAEKNAEILNLTRKVTLQLGNWAHGLVGKFDLVVANPPYVNQDHSLLREVLNDPHIALFGSLSTYIELINSLSKITFKQLLLEVPNNLLDGVVRICEKQGKVEAFQVYDSDIFIVSLLLE